MVYWFIGYPGVGKDYCAARLSILLKCQHIDADSYLTDGERKKLLRSRFTAADRLLKLQRICDDITLKLLDVNTENITVADSLPNQEARDYVLSHIPGEIMLVYVVAPEDIHRQRIADRKNHFFTEDLLDDYIANNWEPVQAQHKTLVNDGSAAQLDASLRGLLANSTH